MRSSPEKKGVSVLSFIYRFVLALNATSWMIVIYKIKVFDSTENMSDIIYALGLLLIPVLLSIISLILSKWFKISEDALTTCEEIKLADNEFLPVYLGYFFVALSVPNVFTLIVVYMIVFLFSFLSETQYFNPLFLLLGYHYYHVKTNRKTNIFIISQGRVIRNPCDVNFTKLRRVNDTKLKADDESFSVNTDAELTLLLYGIEQRFYTTPVGRERRIANSVIKMDTQ